jgi:hypothetical protein
MVFLVSQEHQEASYSLAAQNWIVACDCDFAGQEGMPLDAGITVVHTLATWYTAWMVCSLAQWASTIQVSPAVPLIPCDYWVLKPLYHAL